jgi:EAL domain-containing protein (putative c-di-GMP-specific phosphodiesterase class I)
MPRKTGTISLNMNVASVLSPGFAAFDRAQQDAPDETKIMLELNQVDVFDDMPAYKFASNFLRLRGYAICLDGVTHLTFPFVDRNRLGADYVKIIWSSDMAGDRQDELALRMMAFVERCGDDSVILCRCDSRESIEWGQLVGIRLFQGRIVETLLESTANASRRAAAAS